MRFGIVKRLSIVQSAGKILKVHSITFNDYPHMGGWDATTGVGPKQVGENPLNRNRKLLFVTVERYSLNL